MKLIGSKHSLDTSHHHRHCTEVWHTEHGCSCASRQYQPVFRSLISRAAEQPPCDMFHAARGA